MMLPSFIKCMTERIAGRGGSPKRDTATPVQTSARDLPSTHTVRTTANRQIHRAIDRAIELGMLEHAERIVRTVLNSNSDMTPPLIERIARLHLLQGRPAAALQSIETAGEETSSLRMLRIACLILVGRRLDAHLELHQWSRHNTCPLEARCMLALLDVEDGHSDDASRELLKNIRQLDDPQTFELLAIISAGHQRQEQAATWIERLGRIVQSRAAAPSPRLLAESLDVPITTSIVATPDNVEALSIELLVNEPVIPALVTAQEYEREAEIAQLLYRAVKAALPELTHRDAAIEALARLALVLDRRELAEMWLHVAMDENRITAGMARIARRLTGAWPADRRSSATDPADAQSVIGRLDEAQRDAETENQTKGDGKWKRAA